MNHLTVKVLLACFCAAIFFLYNLSYKSSHNGVSFVESMTQSKKADKLTNNILPNISDISKPSGTMTLKNNTLSQCSVYGPIASDNKNVVDILLSKSKVISLFEQIEQPIYEVYWNLGQDKLQAINLFEIQKNEGPLENEKYKLALNEDNDWVVSISLISANETMARDLATNLAIKANKMNAGGKWQYKNKYTVYYYKTNHNSTIPSEVDAVLQKTFSINKNHCHL